MSTVVSKRHILKFYVTTIFVTLFIMGLATALLFIFKKLPDKRQAKATDALAPVFSIICYAVAGFGIYSYLKNVPVITLGKDFIKFNKKSFSFTDIDKVELTGKQPFKYLINFPMEGAILKFKDGEVKYIYDDMYSNSWELKSFIKQVIIDKKDFFTPIENSIDAESVNNDYYETFKGTVITSLRGISLWGFLGSIAYIFFTNKKPVTIGLEISFGCLSLIWILFHTYLMNYFQVSDNFLVVRNHNFFWMKKAYRITDIEEVVFETQGKMPYCLRIITKYFKSKLYPAGTLRDKNWLDLKAKLETYKIKVRNECV